MRSCAIKMRRQHIDQRLRAIISAGLGNRIHQPAIRRAHPDADATHLNMFVGKSQKRARIRWDSNHLPPLHLARDALGSSCPSVGLDARRDFAIDHDRTLRDASTKLGTVLLEPDLHRRA